jgi:hypothetical protein
MAPNKNNKRKTHKKKGGTISSKKSKTYKTVAESLVSQKIPEQVIGSEIFSFLNDFDKMRTIHGNEKSMVESMEKYFQPTIQYHFICNERTYTDDNYMHPYSNTSYDYPLENTRFSDNIKKRIDACVKHDAIQYLVDKYGERFENAQEIDMHPTIHANVIVSIRLKRNGQAVAREPSSDAPIIINNNYKNAQHKVDVYTYYGWEDGKYGGEYPEYGVLLRNCKKLYAHDMRYQ